MYKAVKSMLALMLFIPLCFMWVIAFIWAVMLPFLIIYCVLNIYNISDWHELTKLVLMWLVSFGFASIGIVLYELGKENK